MLNINNTQCVPQVKYKLHVHIFLEAESSLLVHLVDMYFLFCVDSNEYIHTCKLKIYII